MKSPRLSKAEVERAITDSAGAAKPFEKAPSHADLRDALGVVPNADGKIDATVSLDPDTAEGRRNRGLYRELYDPQWRAEAERASELRGREPVVTIRDQHGRPKKVQERFAERLERRAPSRTTITVPEMPWKRNRVKPEVED